MPVELIVFLGFVVVIAVIGFASSKSTLEQLPPLADETVRLELGPMTVVQGQKERGKTIFKNCVVRITNQRVIVAQSMPLSKRHALRVVITLTEDGASVGQAELRPSYLGLQISRAALLALLEGAPESMDVPMEGSLLIVRQYLTIPLADPAAWREALAAA